jgi:hypothetical protein
MMTLKQLLTLSLLLLLTACSKTKPSAQKDVIYPERLKPNESIVVNYDSQGCFHHRSNVLVFNKESVTVYKNINQRNQKYDKKKKIGTVKLTSSDQARLKALFQYYYQGEEKGNCTTKEEIEMKYYIDKTLISSKKVIDSPCDRLRPKNLTRFDEFVIRAKR